MIPKPKIEMFIFDPTPTWGPSTQKDNRLAPE